MKTILEVLGESSVRAVLIAVTTTCILWGTRVKSPRIRHRTWTGVLVAMLCLPLFSLWAPRIAIPVLPASSIPAAQKPSSLPSERLQAPMADIAVTEFASRKASRLQKPPTQSHVTSPTPSRVNIYRIASTLYLAGFWILVLRLLAGTFLSRQVARGAFREGKILYSQRCSVPVTVGLFHARVFLPAEAKDWDPGKLDAVLTHETEHMRRRDPLVEWMALLNRSVYWFNPLAWWLCGKLSALAEQACDEAVLVRGHDSGVYAEHLLEFARSVKRRGSLVTIWGSSLYGSTLARRVRRILDSGVSPAISRIRLVLVVALWTAAVLVPLFFELSPVHAAAPPSAEAVVPSSPAAAPPEVAAPQSQPSQPTASIPLSRSVVPPDNVLYETGTGYLKASQYIKARLAFQTLINTYPDSRLGADAFMSIGDSFFEEGGAENLARAEAQYKNAAVFFPSDPKAVDALRKVIAIGTGNANALIWAEGYADNFLQTHSDSGNAPIIRQIGQEVSQELARLRFSHISGYVVDSSGNPLKGVSVSPTVSEPFLQATSSDAQGYFVVRGVPLDQQKVELRFFKDGFMTAAYDGANPHTDPLRIAMNTAFIERIEVRGNRRIPTGTILFYIQMKSGEIYDSTKTQYAVAALYATNFFENIQVSQRDGDTGKIITFTLTERPLIRSIEFSGNQSFTEAEILDAFAIAKIGLAVDGLFDYQKVRAAENILHELLARHGKPRGRVLVETESLPPSSIRLRFIINEEP